MMSAMRRWLLVLMVLLLPLRGWVGEAMAGQVLQERVAHVHQVPAAAVHADHAGHHGQGAASTHPGADDHHGLLPSAHGDCGSCAACQVCSSVALSPSPPVIATGSFSQPPPETVQRAYTSAEPLLAFKPPRG